MAKQLLITDIRIGDILRNKTGRFPMRVVTIFEDGDLYLDFDGNEGDVWEENIEDMERAPIEKPKKLKQCTRM